MHFIRVFQQGAIAVDIQAESLVDGNQMVMLPNDGQVFKLPTSNSVQRARTSMHQQVLRFRHQAFLSDQPL